MSAVYTDILNAVQWSIQQIGLKLADSTTLPNGQVYLRKLPTDRGGLTLPCVIVSESPDPETDLGGTNARDDWGHPVLVTTVVASNQDVAVYDWEILWRQQIRRKFHNQLLSGSGGLLATVYICVVEPRTIVDPSLFRDGNLSLGQLLVRAKSREVRT